MGVARWFKAASPVLGLAVVAAGWFVADRLLVADEVGPGEAGAVWRARVVAPPAGAEAEPGTVWVCPAAGPDGGQVVRAVWPAARTDASRVGESVFLETPADGPPVVRSVARDRILLAVAAGLLGVIALVAGRSAWRLLLVLLAGAGSLGAVLAPCLLAGVPPLPAGIVTALVFLTAGAALIRRGDRITLGILGGAVGALAAAVGMALLAVKAGRLTGVYSSLTKDLWYAPATRGMDFPQLLCAGILVAACAIILDLSAAVATAIGQVDQARPGQTRRQLMSAGLAVGRDVMGTELNTLIFAGIGANIAVVLLPMLGSAVPGFEVPTLLVFSEQFVAAEILQVLVGTIALLLTIPATAFLTALLIARPDRGARPPRLLPARRTVLRWALRGVALLGAWFACDWVYARAYHRYAARPGGDAGVSRCLLQATVVSAESVATGDGGQQAGERLQPFTCRVRGGPASGQTLSLSNSLSGFPGHDRVLRDGDPILLNAWVTGGRVTDAALVDFSRGRALIVFAFALLAAIFAVGGRHAWRSLAALAVSGAILVPAVWAVGAAGWHGLWTFLAISLPLCAAMFAILAGIGRKGLSGAAGTFGGLLVGGLVAIGAAAAMGLSGLASDSAMAVRMFAGSGRIDYLGLLQAGMVLGILGAGADTAMAIASATDQVRRSKPEASRRELLDRGLAVGRAVMVPMVLTLWFAYVGLNLPILLLPRILPHQHLPLLVSNERISVEVLRILVGGIGVAATVPVTAALCSLLVASRRRAIS